MEDCNKGNFSKYGVGVHSPRFVINDWIELTTMRSASNLKDLIPNPLITSGKTNPNNLIQPKYNSQPPQIACSEHIAGFPSGFKTSM